MSVDMSFYAECSGDAPDQGVQLQMRSQGLAISPSCEVMPDLIGERERVTRMLNRSNEKRSVSPMHASVR
ncbi:hypothetical protein GCM10009077_00320 [Roseibium denhamense]